MIVLAALCELAFGFQFLQLALEIEPGRAPDAEGSCNVALRCLRRIFGDPGKDVFFRGNPGHVRRVSRDVNQVTPVDDALLPLVATPSRLQSGLDPEGGKSSPSPKIGGRVNVGKRVNHRDRPWKRGKRVGEGFRMRPAHTPKQALGRPLRMKEAHHPEPAIVGRTDDGSGTAQCREPGSNVLPADSRNVRSDEQGRSRRCPESTRHPLAQIP